MLVIADTPPLRYLVVIAAVDVLLPLYARVVVPYAAAEELQHPRAPHPVRTWMAAPPSSITASCVV